LVNTLLPALNQKNAPNGQSYQELLQSYLIATGEYGIQLRVMTRQIGGVHYDRSFAGQVTDKMPLMPVTEDKQKAAMTALAKYAFAPDAFKHFSDGANFLLEQRRGFSHFTQNEDPQLHDRVLAMQVECLSHLLHPNVQQRISDSQLYGGTYSLDKVMTDLTDAIFKADMKGDVNTLRQNLQTEYVQRLAAMLDPKSNYDHVSRGMAAYVLKQLDQQLAASTALGNTLTKAHREHLRTIIHKALDPK
jgi:Met-zincin